MASILFDFDSTLIRCESLEIILAPRLQQQPALKMTLADICRQGMNGEIPFAESLQRRFALLTPTLSEITHFIQQGADMLTAGMASLIAQLQAAGHEVWIVSGGLETVILPFARLLNIPKSRVLAVAALWDQQGHFIEINNKNGMATHKIAGLSKLAASLEKPVYMVGDGATDYAVFEAGIAQYFVAYAEHAKHPALLEKAQIIAYSALELSRYFAVALKQAYSTD